MTEEHASTLISNIDHAVQSGNSSDVFNAVAIAMKAMVHCQYRQGERVKEVLRHIGTIDSNFATCPARRNDETDHERIKGLQTRLDQIERKEEIKTAQRDTVAKMIRALYAISGAAGGAFTIKILEALLN